MCLNQKGAFIWCKWKLLWKKPTERVPAGVSGPASLWKQQENLKKSIWIISLEIETVFSFSKNSEHWCLLPRLHEKNRNLLLHTNKTLKCRLQHLCRVRGVPFLRWNLLFFASLQEKTKIFSFSLMSNRRKCQTKRRHVTAVLLKRNKPTNEIQPKFNDSSSLFSVQTQFFKI